MSSFKEIAIEAVKKAGKIVLNYYNKKQKIRNKSQYDILAEADLESEKVIIKIIKQNFPQHNIISEELGFVDNKSDYTWIIDPLDGTIFFSKSIPLYSVSIGLNYKNNIILGAIYIPCSDELFFAEKGRGAYLNGKRINVSKVNDLSKAAITVDFAPKQDTIEKGINAMKNLANKCFFARALACEVIELVYIACGRFDANIDYDGKLWDLAAAKVILEEAGGKITDIKGNPFIFTMENLKEIAENKYCLDIVASNNKLHNSFLNLIH